MSTYSASKSFAGVVRAVALASAAAALSCSSKSDPTPAPAPTPSSSGDGGSSPAPDPGPVAWRAVVGAGGVFAQTFDDVTWETRQPLAGDLYAVACLGNLAGWTAGAGGAVAHTEDGGKTWSPQASGLTDALRAVRFGARAGDAASLGVVAGEHGAVAVTRDRGVTWAPLHAAGAATDTWRGAAIAIDAGIVVLAGDAGALLRSADAGNTWTRATIAGAGDLRGIASDPGAHLVLAVDQRGTVWSSTDRAASFTRETSASSPLDAVALSDDGSRALVVGAHGTALERDAGGAWHVIATGLDADLHAALLTDGARRAYVAGDHGTLATQPSGVGGYQAITLGTAANLYGLEDL